MKLKELFNKPEFPRASKYDGMWVLDNQMGPNALWLVEWLTKSIDIRPNMRILDLGCGRGMTSIFLAKEFGAKVWACDLWIGPDKNWERVVEAKLSDYICPIRVEAHALPFAKNFFDLIISIDSYQYYGTDACYLEYICNFLRPDGVIAIAVPALVNPIDNEIPSHLVAPQSNGKVFWEDACWSFNTVEWWQRLWSRCGCVTNVQAQLLKDGWKYWLDFETILDGNDKLTFPSDREAIEKDAGRYLGFAKMTATRTATKLDNIYDSSIGLQVGVDG